jgi:sugar lactone lactonase YvrE
MLMCVAGGCARRETPAPDAAAKPERVSVTGGFSTPESVLWDAEQNTWFVSNINGGPLAHDGNGFISRLDRDGAVTNLHWVQGGQNGVTLNGPKGLTLTGDTLWVADIDAVRGFDRRTGAPIASIEFGAQAKFLNDIAAGPDGTLYVTDTGIAFAADGSMSHPGPDRVFAVSGRSLRVALEGAWLEGPNGITWDGGAKRFVVVPFAGKALLGWSPGGTTVDTVGTGPGGQDGVEVLGGEIYATSWADSSLFVVVPGGTRRIAGGLSAPADIGLDPTRDYVAVPRFTENQVEVWRVR